MERTEAGGLGIGVYGSQNGTGWGVYGSVTGAGLGVYGYAGSSGTGVQGAASGSGVGVYGRINSATEFGLAGYFIIGNVQVVGNLSKSSGSFKIDHPLEPANKYLYHSFVESPDMMNIYNGNVVLGENGEAVVELPNWFEALNKDFRYQLTCIGGFAQVYIAEEISNNRFKIAGGTPGIKVSWQITGVRHDPYAQRHRIPVEVDKPAKERGYYLHPEAYGLPREKSIEWARYPEPKLQLNEQ